MNEIQIQNQLESCAIRIEHGAKVTVDGIMSVGKALKEARELLPNNEQFGEWREKRLPWLKRHQALRYMQVFDKFGGALLQQNVASELGASVLYELSAPSTQEQVVKTVIDKVESGEKVTVEEVKRWKEEAKKASEQADSFKSIAQVLSDRIKVMEDSASNRPVVEKIVELEVIPPDYESIKADLESAKAEAAKARAKANKLESEMETAVDAQVKAKWESCKKDVEILDARAMNKQKEIDKIEEQLSKMNRRLSEVKWHEEMIAKHWSSLNDLSIDIGDLDHNPETSAKWLKLASGFANAANIIKQTMCDGRPMTEENYRSLDEHGNLV